MTSRENYPHKLSDMDSFQFALTRSLHVLQFKMDFAVYVQRQGGLAARNHGGIDDTKWASSDSLPCFSQQIQGD